MPEEIFLAISGGGYRAMLFHAGVFYCLYQYQLLHRVRIISSVSGGGLLSGILIRRLMEKPDASLPDLDWDGILTEVRQVAKAQDLRTSAVSPVVLILMVFTVFFGLVAVGSSLFFQQAFTHIQQVIFAGESKYFVITKSTLLAFWPFMHIIVQLTPNKRYKLLTHFLILLGIYGLLGLLAGSTILIWTVVLLVLWFLTSLRDSRTPGLEETGTWLALVMLLVFPLVPTLAPQYFPGTSGFWQPIISYLMLACYGGLLYGIGLIYQLIAEKVAQTQVKRLQDNMAKAVLNSSTGSFAALLTPLQQRDLTFMFCGTNLNLSSYVIYGAEGLKAKDYTIHCVKDHPLAEGMAVSACFPPVFTPKKYVFNALDIEFKNHASGSLQNLVRLAYRGAWINDGGNFDNMGVDPLLDTLKEQQRTGALFFSDASGVGVPSGVINRFFIVLNYANLIYREQRRLRVEMVRSFLRTRRFPGLYIGIDERMREDEPWMPDYIKPICFSETVVEDIAQTRTDFADFEFTESERIVMHGYVVTCAKLSKYFGLPDMHPRPLPYKSAAHAPSVQA